MSNATKVVRERFGNPDKDGYYSGAYIFSDGTAEFVCGYSAPTANSSESEEYHNVTPTTPKEVYAKYGKPQDSLGLGS